MVNIKINLNLICCPKCQSNLEKISNSLLICNSCKKEFIIKDNIPVLLNNKI